MTKYEHSDIFNALIPSALIDRSTMSSRGCAHNVCFTTDDPPKKEYNYNTGKHESGDLTMNTHTKSTLDAHFQMR